MSISRTKLKMLTPRQYDDLRLDPNIDPIEIYFKPIFGKFYKRRVELCLDELVPGKKVLEIGYGSGVTFLNLHEQFSEIDGLDVNAPSERVTALYGSLGIDVNLRKGNVLKMPYPDNSFDCVLAISILEHLQPEEQLIAMGEIQRVLNKGGQFIYGVPVASKTMELFFRILGFNINEHHYSTELDVDRAASKAFEKIRIKNLFAIPGLIRVYQTGHFKKL